MCAKALRQMAACGVVLLAMGWSADGKAIVVNLDRFAVTRDGAAFFTDDFADGVAPPSAPNFASGSTASYSVSGSFPSGSESGGTLQLDSANGALGANAIETPRRTLLATLLTSTGTGTTLLGVGNTLVESGLFGLVTPTGPNFSAYGVRFADAANGTAHQLAQLFVRFNDTTGRTEVAYILQDFDAGTITTLGTTPFAPPSGADEIMLTMSRPTTTNDDFFASFSYLAAGSIVGSGSFSTPAVLFQGEDFVRGQFFVAQAIPEPDLLALLGIGGVFTLVVSRRAKRGSAAAR